MAYGGEPQKVSSFDSGSKVLLNPKSAIFISKFSSSSNFILSYYCHKSFAFSRKEQAGADIGEIQFWKIINNFPRFHALCKP